jgi:hypothetical protein
VDKEVENTGECGFLKKHPRASVTSAVQFIWLKSNDFGNTVIVSNAVAKVAASRRDRAAELRDAGDTGH